MKYYSEKLDQLFKSEDNLKKAEKLAEEKLIEKQKLEEQREVRAKEVRECHKKLLEVRKKARKEVFEADEKYNKLVSAFIKDFNTYSTSDLLSNFEGKEYPDVLQEILTRLFS